MNKPSRVLCGAGRFCVFWIVWAASGAFAQTPRDFAIDLYASVSTNVPRITLNWTLRRPGNIMAQAIHRRLKGDTVWVKQAELATNTVAYADHTAAVGVEYEYWLERTYVGIYPSTAMGYLSAGVNVPMAESRGRLLLVVDDTMLVPLSPELDQLRDDLVGDGWMVQTLTAARGGSAASVKAQIVAAYGADPANTKMVYLLGHVPVPYSGEMAPDLHVPEHLGAWPADGYYGDIDGIWTDSSVNNTAAARSQNDNVPGDGKFDQNYFPSLLELAVGRVDLHGMTRAPCSAVTETALLRRYLRKAHAFRMRLGEYASIPRQSLIRDGFGHISGESFAIAGWAWAFTGAGSLIDEAPADQWFFPSYAGGTTYLIAYGNGGGSYESAGGVGSTSDFGLKASRAIFTSLFGSYFGDWDAENSLLRAPLAGNATGDSLGLTCFWGGRPNRFMHHLGLGETAGYGMLISQNGSLSGGGGYTPNNDARTHTALMGDPALRLYPVHPVRDLSAFTAGGHVYLSWSASGESDLLGYHVYRADVPAGPYSRLTTDPLSSTAFDDSTVTAGQSYTYMVRTLKRETAPGGTFDNLSVGTPMSITVSASGTAAPRNPSGLSVAVSASTNAVLIWTDNAVNENGFRIERKTNATGGFCTIGTVSSNVTTFTDSGVFTNGNVYYYRVYAIGSVGDSLASGIVSFDAVAGFINLPVTRVKVDKAAGAVAITVDRIGGTVGSVSANFATTNISAIAGIHYTATNGVLTWADGDNAPKTVVVKILNTPAAQAACQFSLVLGNPSGGTALTMNASAAVLIEDLTAALAPPWSQTIVGAITDSSAAVTVSNAICSTTLGGGGLAELATSDAGQFVYQYRTGDGTITAYFPAGAPVDSSARYALMVRAATSSNSAMAAAVAGSSAEYGAKFVTRSSAGAEAALMPSLPNAWSVPCWLRLNRIGARFTAEASSDGNEWALIGSTLLPSMPSTAAWGIFHCSSDWSSTSLGNYHLSLARNVDINDIPAPSAPTGLLAAAASPTRVILTWCAVANAAGYRIERMAETGSYTQLVELVAGSGPTQTWTDATVVVDSGYWYRIRAFNATGVSPYSSPAAVATPPGEIVELISADGSNGADAMICIDSPANPLGTATNLAVTGYDPETWEVADNAAKCYLRFDLTGRSFDRATLRLAFLQAERFDETGFINHYLFLLADNSDNWNESTITWNNAPQNNTAGVGFTGSPTYLGYTNLYAVPDAGEVVSFVLPAAALAAARGTNGLVTLGLAQLSAGATAHWASREHPVFDAPALTLASRSLAPTRPTFFTATVEAGWAVTLRWTDSDATETGFEIQRRETNGVFATLLTLTSNTVSFVDGTSSPDSVYDYRICAFNAYGTSTWATAYAVITPDRFHAVGSVWDGGGADMLLTTGANWDTDVTPVLNGTIYANFASGGSIAIVNTNAAFFGLSIHRNADFTIVDGGGALILGEGGVRAVNPDADSREYTVAAPIALAAEQRWGVTNNGAALTALTISGPISDGAASYGIAKSGNGRLILAGSNTYDGVTTVLADGSLCVAHDNGLGSTNGNTTVASGGWLEISNGVAVAEPLRLPADDTGGQGNLRSVAGTNRWTGTITQTASARVRALSGSSLLLSGGVTGSYDLILAPDANAHVGVSNAVAIGSARKLVANGSGLVSIAGTGHTFGSLEVAGVTVRTDTPYTLPASTILSIGTSFSPNGIFDLNGCNQTVSQLKRGIVSAGTRIVTSSAPATLTINNTTAVTYDGQLNGELSLVKTNSSTLTLSGPGSSYSGTTTIMAGTFDVTAPAIGGLGQSPNVLVLGGTLRLRNASAIADTAALRIASPGKVRLDAVTEHVRALYFNGVRQNAGTWGSTASLAANQNNTFFDSSGTGIISVAYAPRGTVWDGGGSDTLISTPDNWDTDWEPVFDGTTSVTFGTGGNLATVNTNAAFLGVTLNRNADFTLADGGGTLTLGKDGLLALNPGETARVYTVAARLMLATNQTWGVTNADTAATTLIVSGVVSDGPNVSGLVATGDGSLVLAGSNTYGGVTTVASGTVLRVVHNCGLGTTNGATVVSLGGRLSIGGGISVREPLTLNTGEAEALFASDGTNIWSGRITQSRASCIAARPGSFLTLSGGVSGSFDLTLAPDADSALFIDGPITISGSHSLIARGSGLVRIAGSGHTFGVLDVSGATVRMDAPNVLPASTVVSLGSAVSPNGVFDLNGHDQTVGQLKRGISTPGSRIVTSATPATLTVSGSTSTLFDGALTGQLNLVKTGSSTLTLGGAGNAFTGAVVVGGGALDLYSNATFGASQNISLLAGSVRLRGDLSIQDSATLRIANGALLRIDSGEEIVDSLYLNGVRQRRGTYGSTSSAAQNQDNSHFSTSGSGVIKVLRGTESVFMVR